MANELYVDPCFPIHFLLEREDHEHLVYKPAKLFHPAFSPRPHLWADVINDRDSGVPYPLAEPQIEIGEVDENRSRRRIRFHSLCEPPEDTIKARERTHYLKRPDDCGFADVTFELNARLAHALPAETINLTIRKLMEKSARDLRAIHVARSLAGDHQKPVRTHGTRFFNSRKWGIALRTSMNSCHITSWLPIFPIARTLYSPSGMFLNSNFPSVEVCIRYSEILPEASRCIRLRT